MDVILHHEAAWLDMPEVEVMELCAWGVRWILDTPKKVRQIDALDWASIQSLLLGPSEGGPPLRPCEDEIEQGPCFRERQRQLRCPREGLFAEAAE